MVLFQKPAYLFAMMVMVFATGMAVIAMLKTPGVQIQSVMEWWGSFAAILVPLVIGGDKVGSALKRFGEGYKAKHNGSNDHRAPK